MVRSPPLSCSHVNLKTRAYYQHSLPIRKTSVDGLLVLVQTLLIVLSIVDFGKRINTDINFLKFVLTKPYFAISSTAKFYA